MFRRTASDPTYDGSGVWQMLFFAFPFLTYLRYCQSERRDRKAYRFRFYASIGSVTIIYLSR